ncbi:glyoxalase superfamily protein [Chitinimonas koreensis]|uniref:glyoxalase superfamily protein n=1 Tax=Chitinimonas koreensis TaxID=356302 RepID=UPI0012F8CA87|nr:glyoxalase superfamily protein [Chitinimonas koreensis]QNM96641.1 hypothetical protein H9L41_23295 [Chitinimonas koreensis]
MQTVIPQLRMTEAARNLAFYIEGLGFAIDWEHRCAPEASAFLRSTLHAASADRARTIRRFPPPAVTSRPGKALTRYLS